jgi:2-methylcitrate dehydratase PrpD
MNETRTLAGFVADTGFEDLPADLAEQAKGYVLDNIGSGFTGSVQRSSNLVADLIAETGAGQECTVFSRSWRTNPGGAALVNGTMIGSSETDHSFSAGSVHPAATVFPAALAMAEREHRDGKSFLAAMMLGYEVACRIGHAATRAVEDERGFYGPGSNGPFGAAMAAGKLLGLDRAALTNALGIAGSHCAGTMEFAWEGSMVKRLHVGRAAQMGLESALLAAKGFTGPPTILEGRYGFLNLFSPSPHPERLLADLGKDWIARRIGAKSFVCYGAHKAVIEGLIAFKSGRSLDPRMIRRIVITGNPTMILKHEDKEPKTISGAQYSLPFAAAVTLLRDIANPLAFTEETLRDAEIREFMNRVETVADPQRFPPLPREAAEIVIEMDDGRHVMNVSDYKGSPTNPFLFEDFSRKFRSYSAQRLGPARTEAIIEIVGRVDALNDIKELTGLIGA